MSAGQARSAEEKQRDSQELEALRQREHAARRSRTFQRGTRYHRDQIQSLSVKHLQIAAEVFARRQGKPLLQLQPLKI